MTEKRISGWGNYPKVPTNLAEYKNKITGLATLRGNGRSYGDQAICEHGDTLNNLSNNRIIDFDTEKASLIAESGLLISELIEICLPKGFFPKICPGTKLITLGGAIANNVHGKGHHKDGSFISCVNWFNLRLVNNDVLNCSREKNSTVFYACAGAAGLLGAIEEVSIQLDKVSNPFFEAQSFKTYNLEEMFELLDGIGQKAHYSVGWLNYASNKASGVLTTGEKSNNKNNELPQVISDRAITVPPIVPSGVLNKFSLKALNTYIAQKQLSTRGRVHYNPFFFPLDGFKDWNNGYGKNGFIQYQFVVPLSHGFEAAQAVHKMCKEQEIIPFLNVIKRFGVDENGFLSFPEEGYTLALDFPVNRRTLLFCQWLDQLVLKHKGKIYLAKDATCSAYAFKRMYAKNLEEFLQLKRQIDPKSMLKSAQSQRLQIT